MGHISNSINVKGGSCVNELEALFILLDKLIETKLEHTPKAGIIISKGQPNEVRLRYKDAQKTLEKLYSSYAIEGCFSIGICQTCDSFNSLGYGAKTLGKCGGREVSWCGTCEKHSVSGGGFGL